MKKDWAGIKFNIMKEMGECIDMIYIKEFSSNSRQEFYLKPHSHCDGVSGFAQAIELADKIPFTELPTVRSEEKPSKLKRLKLALDHLKRQSPVNYCWKKHSKKMGTAASVEYAFLDKTSTIQLENHAKESGVNLNSFLLSTLDQTSKNLLESSEKRVWMVPVNIRHKEDSKSRKGNFVTVLSVHIKNEGAKEIYQQIKSMMKSGIIWGGEIVADTPRFIGEKNLRRLSKNIKTPYIGLCSNVGAWPLDTTEKTSPHQWIVAAPVTSFCPISSAISKWYGSLSISNILHPSISECPKFNRSFFEAWIMEIERSSKLKLNITKRSIPWNTIAEKKISF